MAYDGETEADNGVSRLNGDEPESGAEEPTFRAFWADGGGLPKEGGKTPPAAYAHMQGKEVLGVRPEIRCASDTFPLADATSDDQTDLPAPPPAAAHAAEASAPSPAPAPHTPAPYNAAAPSSPDPPPTSHTPKDLSPKNEDSCATILSTPPQCLYANYSQKAAIFVLCTTS
jgi:hypothetical protein